MTAVQYAIAAGILAGMLPTAAHSQRLQATPSSDGASDALRSALGCPRPADTRDAKVVDFDTTTGVARLAVRLGNDRFKLVTINPGESASDPRPLAPVLEAARILQGTVQFFAPDQSSDPESKHEKFVMLVEMGSGTVCWAKPGSLLDDGAYPVAGVQGAASGPRGEADAAAKKTGRQ